LKPRIGILGHLSGPFVLAWRWFQQGIEAKGLPCELVYRDIGSTDAAGIRRIVEDLDVSVLAGFYLSGDAIAAAPVINARKIPAVLFNAASHTVLSHSPYFVRVGSSIWQAAVPAAEWAIKNGKKRAYIAVADNLPGHDVQEGFRTRFTALGGTIAGEHRMPPDTQDFAPHAERILAADPDVIQIFVATRISQVPIINALAAKGAFAGHRSVISLGNDTDIDLYDERAIGCYSVNHYAPSLSHSENHNFRKAIHDRFGSEAEPISAFMVEGYDGMHLVARMLETGKGVDAVRGYAWTSPRGPVRIEADTRDITQNIYIRRLEKAGGRRHNVIVDTFPALKDPWVQKEAQCKPTR
jgi:branched-chain amino acid transport system substrate-binding protein